MIDLTREAAKRTIMTLQGGPQSFSAAEDRTYQALEVYGSAGKAKTYLTRPGWHSLKR